MAVDSVARRAVIHRVCIGNPRRWGIAKRVV